MDLRQICEAVEILSDFYPDKKDCFRQTDKIWSGILDKVDHIDSNSLSMVCSTLPHLRSSRDVILKLVEEKIPEFWNEYSVKNILEILRVLTEIKHGNKKLLSVISQWLRVNIHVLAEAEVLAVIYCFHKLDFVDEAVVTTCEKYMKIRGCQIKEKDLVATLCDYVVDFRVRSPVILEGVSEYFIHHGKALTTPQVIGFS